jgi:hypothetical protein
MPNRKFTINRLTWNQGNHFLGSQALENAIGLKCCLGFDLLDRGVPREYILHKRTPMSVQYDGVEFEDLSKVFSTSQRKDNTALSVALMESNDSKSPDVRESYFIDILGDDYSSPWREEGRSIADEEREKLISDIYKTINVDVEFVGEYPEEERRNDYEETRN